MPRVLQFACLLAGGASIVVGTATLLILARHGTALLITGVGLLVVGLVVVLAVPGGRRRAFLTWITVAVLLTVGLWYVARIQSRRGKEPVAPSRETGIADEALDAVGALERGLELARTSLRALDGYPDYTCRFHKRERARGLLGEERLTDIEMSLKLRHEPFSVYAMFDAPEAKRGTEVIYVEGRNEGKLIAHAGGARGKLLGTMRLVPTGWQAMIDHRHPITRIGMRNVALELVKFVEENRAHLERCEIRILAEDSAGRPCRCLEVRSPAPAAGFALALARVCFDRELGFPVSSERWEYIDVDGEVRKLLVEEYVYTDIALDRSLTDADFDPDNPEYGY